MSYVNANKRPKDVFIDSNTFTAMHDSVYPIIHVEFYTAGEVYLTGNTFYDSSSEQDMIELDANEAIILENNTFEYCIEKSNGFLRTGTAHTVNVTGLVVTHTVGGTSATTSPLFIIGTKDLGECNFEYSNFNSNHLKDSILDIDQSVGLISFHDNTAYNETVHSYTSYIKIENPYELKMTQTTFINITDDKTNEQLTQLVSFESINLNEYGEIHMDEIVLSNTSISFFSINAVSGATSIKKEIIFENITIRDSYYEARNPLINLGPFYTNQDVHLGLSNLTFYGLVFEDTSNVIHINWQSPTPITIEG